MADFQNPWAPLTTNGGQNTNSPVNYLNSGPLNWQLISSNFNMIPAAPKHKKRNWGPSGGGGGGGDHTMQDIQSGVSTALQMVQLLKLLAVI